MDASKKTTTGTTPLAALLTRRDLGALLRIGDRTLTRLVNAKQLPQPIRVGKRWRWRRTDIERFPREAGQPDPGS